MLPKTTSQQRERFYSDVEELLSPGFLAHSVNVGRVRFTLRSLCPNDTYLLRYRADLSDNALIVDWKRWAISHSVWMVNGSVILDNHNAPVRIYEMLEKVPARAVDILYSVLLGLLKRSDRALEGLEAYFYESSSRTKWRSVSDNVSAGLGMGFPGAERLGQNLLQRLWVVFNRTEDERLSLMNSWEGFKLVASSNSPKGVSKIDQKDMQRKREEDERRQSVMDRYYYYRTGVVDHEGFIQNRDKDLVGSKVGGPKSVEQLEDEMRRWVSGDNDEHDNIVESYKQRILDRQDQIEREREERRRRLLEEAALRDQQGFEPTPMVGYTQDQMAQILAERGQGRPSGARFVYDDNFQQTKNRLDRHVQKAGSGNLRVRDGRVVDPQSNPKTDQRTLQELIQGRNVQYSDEAPQDLREDSEKIDSSVFGSQTRRRD